MMSNNSNSSPRRLFVQTGGAAGAHLNLPFLYASNQLGSSEPIDNDSTTPLRKTNEDIMLIEEQKLINKSISDLFYNNHNLTDKKRAKNVIEQAPCMQNDGGTFFLDDGDDYDDDDDDYDLKSDKNDFNKISNDLNEQLKNSPNKNDYLEVSESKQDLAISPRISLKTGLSSDSYDSRSSSRTSGSSSIKSSDMLKIDPNYKWLLKDIKLSNNKRVIDVTELIDLNDSHKIDENRIETDSSSVIPETETENESDDKPTNTSRLPNDTVNKELAKSLEAQQQHNNSDSDNYDEFKNDNSYISKLYKKLVNNSGANENEKTTDIEDDANDKSIYGMSENKNEQHHHVVQQMDDDEDDEEEHITAYASHNDSVYKQWPKNYRQPTKIIPDSSNDDEYEDDCYENNNKNNQKKAEITQPDANKAKKHFSKSFEISLDDLDNLIDRVDNGIKLKRTAKKAELELKPKLNNEQQTTIKSDMSIESLKQEWSQMFNKLESDYKSKLDEQQKMNEFKLKQLHDEIKQSIILQQQSITNSAELHNQLKEQEQRSKSDDLKSTTESSKASETPVTSSVTVPIGTTTSPGSTISNTNSCSMLPPKAVTSNFVDNNSKYITNLRMELKSKHSRHVQDLKEYYEKELEELKRKLNFYEKQQMNHLKANKSPSTDLSCESDNNSVNDIEEQFSEHSLKQQQLNDKNHALLHSELKSSNSTLLNKLYESSQHIRYLTQENCDLTSKINQMDVDLKQSNEKITNLEHCCTQLELQLTDTIKLQDQYIRELHAEKRNLVKKMQECEELKMSCKFYEQKCDTYELKLDEKDSVITRLKTQLIQAETDLNRLEYEFKKSLSTNKVSQQPAATLQDKSKTQQAQQLTIKNQQTQQHPIPVIITNTNGCGSGTSSSSMSPSSPNSMSKTLLNNKQSNVTTNGFTSSASMSQLNSQRITFQNDSNSSQNNSLNNGTNLLIAETNNNCNNKEQNGTNNRPFQYSTDKINAQYSRRSQQDYQQNQFRQSRNMSVSPSRFIEREELNRNFKAQTNNNSNNLLQSTSVYSIKANSKCQSDTFADNKTTNDAKQQQQQQQSQQNGGLFKLVPDVQLKYIEHLEFEFDMLMKHKQQLDAQLTRLPYKATNTNMHTLRQSVENELNLVEKKLASVKLELRKLNIIKTH